MKGSELKGRAVVTLQEAAKIGSIASVILDPSTSRVLGLKIKTGVFSGDRYVLVSDIRSVGADAVTVPDAARLREKLEDVPELKGMPDLDDIENIKVVSESGSLVGSIDDVVLDMQNYHITSYQLGGSLWQNLTGSQKTFQAPGSGMRFGKGLLIVPDSVAAQLGTPSPAPNAPALDTPTPTVDTTATAVAATADYSSSTTPVWTDPAPSIDPTSWNAPSTDTTAEAYRPSWADTGTTTSTTADTSNSTTTEPSTASTTSYPASLGNLLEPNPTLDNPYTSSARVSADTAQDGTSSTNEEEKGRGGQSTSTF